jgi:hypothetical protein
MSAPLTARIALENLTADARATAPGEGRRPVYEAGREAVHVLLENFSAMTPMETEEADARIHLTTPAQRVVVRHAGGRLILDDGASFTDATVEDIMVRIFGTEFATQISEVDQAPQVPAVVPSAQSRRGKFLIFVILVGVFALVNWWIWRDKDDGGVEWIQPGKERQAILNLVSGAFASPDERLRIDASSGQLTVSDLRGRVVLRTSFRVGRSPQGPVIVTEAGVVYDVIADGILRLGSRTYRRI